MKDLSIIIISYNTKDITKKCLETVVASLSCDPEIKAEIIVLDNASTDGSVEMLDKMKNEKGKMRDESVELKIIESKENRGFARGNNEAVKHAKGKHLLFLNSDIEVLDDAIPQLYRYFTSTDNQFHFVGGKLLEKDGHTPQDSAGPFYSLPVAFAALFLRADYYHFTRYSPKKMKEVDWVSGACIMCSKNDYDKIDGFDENIFMYMDEVDLLYRAKKKDMRVGFYPDAQFIHLGSASSASRTQPILQVYKGFLYFYKKHHSPLQLSLLKSMLQLKARVALMIGHLTKNTYLIKTYEQALILSQDS